MADVGADQKIQEICKVIEEETLLPARAEAQKYIEEGKAEAANIIKKANEEAAEILAHAKKEIEKEKRVAQSSIDLAVKQGLSQLRQSVLGLFRQELSSMIGAGLSDAKTVGNILNALVKAIDEQGVSSSIAVYVGKEVNLDEVQRALLDNVVNRIGQSGVQLGDLPNGLVLKQKENNLSIEVSDKALMELLGEYLIDGLKEKLYNEQ